MQTPPSLAFCSISTILIAARNELQEKYLEIFEDYAFSFNGN